MTTFLKRLLFDDERLRERTLTELVRAFSTGRMVAFVGSMATESQGYGDWDDLVKNYVKCAAEIAQIRGDGPAVQGGCSFVLQALDRIPLDTSKKNKIEVRAALSLAREALDHLDAIDPLSPGVAEKKLRELDAKGISPLAAASPGVAKKKLRKPDPDGSSPLTEAAQGLLYPKPGAEREGADVFASCSRTKLLDYAAVQLFRQRVNKDQPSVVRLLFRELRIQRFATLNYDLEIEAELMLERSDAGAGDEPIGALLQLFRTGLIRRDPTAPLLMSRLLADGMSVESDVRDRERPDRLIEFAIGSTLVDRRIMHLHGRATDPQTMIIGHRDYDRLYRRNDPARVPFDHGQRILFAGNPVLFVGTGMGEQELTWTLQEFVSNHPYRRFAPAFLFWETAAFSTKKAKRQSEKWLKRIDFFRRFGVLTVFDEDLRPPDHPPRSEAATELLAEQRKVWRRVASQLKAAREIPDDQPKKRRPIETKLLVESISLLARACAVHDIAQREWGKSWRRLTTRLEHLSEDADDRAGEQKAITLWETPDIRSTIAPDLEKLFNSQPAMGMPLRAVIATAGSGKGVLAWHIANAQNAKLPGDFDATVRRRLIINAGYALDSDFLLLAITRFVFGLKGRTGKQLEAIGKSRERLFDRDDVFNLPGCGKKRALIIINGLQRFFTIDGAPLSAELDHLFRRIATGPAGDVRWLFLGSPRIERYFRTISPAAVVQFTDVVPRAGAGANGAPRIIVGKPTGHRKSRKPKQQAPRKAFVGSVYFDYLIASMRKLISDAEPRGAIPPASFGDSIVLAAHMNAAPRELARSVVDAFVTRDALHAICPEPAGLAMEILRTLAFIGNPIEAAVLLHAPRIRELMNRASGHRHPALRKVLGTLTQAGLVVAFERLNNYPSDEEQGWMWRRYGLHTVVAAELRKRVGVQLTESKLSTSFNMSLFVAQPVDSTVPDPRIHEELGQLVDHLVGAYKDDEQGLPAENSKAESARRSGPHATACLRAALALIRSYYSTTNLLTLDCDETPRREDQNGVLLEHAERLETMLVALRKMRRARDDAVTTGNAGQASDGEPAPDTGPEPFFAEDVIWILNELGVVYLAQGDLYSARRNFAEATTINGHCVEFNCRSHNWRRIAMNRVMLDIERAALSSADEKLREIEHAIDERVTFVGRRGGSRFARIRERFGQEAPPERSCFDPSFMHEDVLMTGLVLGHRAMLHHVRGHLAAAVPLYQEAIAILRRLGEHRAYAMFQRLYAQLLGIIDPAQSEPALRLAVTAAESVRQKDMAHHARIVAAHESWQAQPGDSTRRRQAVDLLSSGLAYAATMDLHRLRVEAGLYLARLKLDSGDYDSALEHAADALSVAARCGLSLRKISLRIEIGHILKRRGDVRSGSALIREAIKTADQFGYQRAVELAQSLNVPS